MAAVAVVSSDGGRDGSSLFAIHASNLAALVAVNCRCNDSKLIPALH